MNKLICSVLLTVFSLNAAYASNNTSIQHSSDYEGWVWRKSLNFTLPNNSDAFVDADLIHNEMALLAKNLQPISSSKNSKIKETGREGKNLALIRIGFIIEDCTERKRQSYISSACFDNYACYSVQDTHRPSTAEEAVLEKARIIKTPFVKQYVINEPINYSFTRKYKCNSKKYFSEKSKNSKRYR